MRSCFGCWLSHPIGPRIASPVHMQSSGLTYDDPLCQRQPARRGVGAGRGSTWMLNRAGPLSGTTHLPAQDFKNWRPLHSTSWFHHELDMFWPILISWKEKSNFCSGRNRFLRVQPTTRFFLPQTTLPPDGQPTHQSETLPPFVLRLWVCVRLLHLLITSRYFVCLPRYDQTQSQFWTPFQFHVWHRPHTSYPHFGCLFNVQLIPWLFVFHSIYWTRM